MPHVLISFDLSNDTDRKKGYEVLKECGLLSLLDGIPLPESTVFGDTNLGTTVDEIHDGVLEILQRETGGVVTKLCVAFVEIMVVSSEEQPKPSNEQGDKASMASQIAKRVTTRYLRAKGLTLGNVGNGG